MIKDQDYSQLQEQPCDCKVCARLRRVGSPDLKAQNEALRAENESLKAKIDELCDQLNIYVNGSETEEEL